VDWSAAAGREHPTGSARQNVGAKTATDWSSQSACPTGLRSAGRPSPYKRNRHDSPVSIPDNHNGTPKVVKETSRTFKGGASNLPAALTSAAREAYPMV
jgi:hypothetical protein